MHQKNRCIDLILGPLNTGTYRLLKNLLAPPTGENLKNNPQHLVVFKVTRLQNLGSGNDGSMPVKPHARTGAGVIALGGATKKSHLLVGLSVNCSYDNEHHYFPPPDLHYRHMCILSPRGLVRIQCTVLVS